MSDYIDDRIEGNFVFLAVRATDGSGRRAGVDLPWIRTNSPDSRASRASWPRRTTGSTGTRRTGSSDAWDSRRSATTPRWRTSTSCAARWTPRRVRIRTPPTRSRPGPNAGRWMIRGSSRASRCVPRTSRSTGIPVHGGWTTCNGGASTPWAVSALHVGGTGIVRGAPFRRRRGLVRLRWLRVRRPGGRRPADVVLRRRVHRRRRPAEHASLSARGLEDAVAALETGATVMDPADPTNMAVTAAESGRAL